MKVPFNNLKAHYESMKPEIDRAVAEVLNSGTYIGGKFIADFETRFAQFYQAKFSVAVANGTDALFIALKSLNIGTGDEVVTSAYSWIATANAISLTGATPVFVDIDPKTLLIDLSKIEEKISAKTKAILPVHLFGQMVDMLALKKLADHYKLKIVEDAAQAHGSTFNGHFPGKYSDLACFSFYPTKQLGAMGDAGAILTNHRELADGSRRLSHHGTVYPRQDFLEIGINSRLDPIQAHILNQKISKLSEWIDRRKAIAAQYQTSLKNCNYLSLPEVKPLAEMSYYLFPVFTKHRSALMAYMNECGIGTDQRYSFTLTSSKPYYQQQIFEHAEKAAKTIVNLPIYPELTDDQVQYVIDCLLKFQS